jgi:TPR repeat protein
MKRLVNAACWLSAAALVFGSAAWSGAAAQEDENPHTPGAIPNPGSYQGSMELQRRSDQQDQQFREQQQRSYQQPSYQQPRYGAQPHSRAPQAPPPASPPPLKGAEAFGKESAGDALGSKAASRGDFAGAVRIWLPLAEKGDVNAQYNMGVMYDLGHGVPMNKAEAAAWYRKAANKGYGTAMVNLSNLIAEHARGSGELIPAYMWLVVASNRDPISRKDALHNMGILSGHMSRADVRQAEEFARGWTPH